MPTLEEIGKRLDREIEKLKVFVEKDLKPTTERKTAAALRAASRKLDELAAELEERLSRSK